MPIVSYFNLNQTYVINTVIFFGTFLIAIVWMHVHLHASVMKDMGQTCNDPIASFFNKRLADRCYVDTITRSATWVDKNLDNIVNTLNKRQEATNTRILGLYSLYNDRNKQQASAFAKKIEDKKQAIDELQMTVNDIKTGVTQNEKNVMKILDDYRDVIRDNINKLRMLATEIVNKLNRNVYTKNYKNERQNYIGAYNKIDNYVRKINQDGLFETEIDKLPEIPKESRNGRD